MRAELSGKTVLVLGGNTIAAAMDRALTSAGAECLHDCPEHPVSAGQSLHGFVACGLGGSDEGERILARLRDCFPGGVRHVIVVSPILPPADDKFVREAAIEAWCRQLAARQLDGLMNVNVLRHRRPPSPAAAQFTPTHLLVPDEEIASAALALCSGRMDAVHGQTLIVDRGATFCDNPMRLYAERGKRGGGSLTV